MVSCRSNLCKFCTTPFHLSKFDHGCCHGPCAFVLGTNHKETHIIIWALLWQLICRLPPTWSYCDAIDFGKNCFGSKQFAWAYVGGLVYIFYVEDLGVVFHSSQGLLLLDISILPEWNSGACWQKRCSFAGLDCVAAEASKGGENDRPQKYQVIVFLSITFSRFIYDVHISTNGATVFACDLYEVITPDKL